MSWREADVSLAKAHDHKARLVLGKPVADHILADVKEAVREVAHRGRRPRLVSVAVGEADAAAVYIRNQARITAQCGIEFVELPLAPDITEEALLKKLRELNVDDSVTGVIIQRPLPGHISVKAVQSAIDPLKDVEGLHPTSIGEIVYGHGRLGPCTALAAVAILKSIGLQIEGLEVVVIGHSDIVGKPIAFMLMAQGATVTVCHHLTRSVAMHSRRADVVFVAIGKPELVGGEMIKPGAVVIDIGINPIVRSNGASNVVGDVNVTSVEPVAGWLTPVPGGVGPVTLAMLMRNTVAAARAQSESPSSSDSTDRVFIRDLRVSGLIGVQPHELDEPQPIIINAELETRRGGGGLGVVCYAELAAKFEELVVADHVALVEDLADQLAAAALGDERVQIVRIRVEKPTAITGAAGVGVEIVRRRPFFPHQSARDPKCS